MRYLVPTYVRIAPRRDQRGEGVISVAVAVLIIAILGVAAYAAFDRVFDTAVNKAETNVNNVGGG
jgi:Tfp pilus assembly protein PilE